MKKEVLIILGSPNSPSGALSDISISRLNDCVNRYQKGDFILCTGGWGAHFNISKSSHAALAKQYLMGKGKWRMIEKGIAILQSQRKNLTEEEYYSLMKERGVSEEDTKIGWENAIRRR